MIKQTVTLDENQLMIKLRRKIIPFVLLLYIIAMIDRVNIGFAALNMNKDLGISASTYGFIAGIFFLAYFFFEVPSNVFMYKFGARKWIARILISWGLVVCFMGVVHTGTQLGILRVCLGIAEAGFYPGLILYFTYWFPQRYQAKAVALFMLAIGIANIFGGPISTWILDNISWMGMAGWRWMFILEGIPAVILGVVCWFKLVDRPQDAKFLTEDEKIWLSTELKNEDEVKMSKHKISKWEALKNGRVWVFGLIYFCYVIALYGVGLWMPQIIKGLGKGLTNTQVGLVSAIPYIFALTFMVLVGNHSDKTGERRWHAGLPLLLAAVCLVLVTFTTHNFWLSIALLTLASCGIYGFVGCFWTMPNNLLAGATAAVGVALINSVGNLGGFFGPYIVGFIKDLTGSTGNAMYLLAAFTALGWLLCVTLPKPIDFNKSHSNKQELPL